jgi:protein-arginine kinase activator protein McsA
VSLGALRAQLQKAIEDEEFEKAARLRDEIRLLELTVR